MNKTYYLEITTLDEVDKSARVVEVEARHAPDAYRLGTEHLGQDEFIRQISTEVAGSALPQPVYDYWNGFLNEGMN